MRRRFLSAIATLAVRMSATAKATDLATIDRSSPRRRPSGFRGRFSGRRDRSAADPHDELPMPGRSKIDAMAADPAHPEGEIAAVEGRGVVFVRVDAR